MCEWVLNDLWPTATVYKSHDPKRELCGVVGSLFYSVSHYLKTEA